jgi:ribonuclease HII
MISGIDEAGRGAVIGPLVICIASIDKMDEYKLKEMGARDSKKLTRGRRETLFPKIKDMCKLTIIKITAEELNKLMDKYSLNEIEALKIAEGLNISGKLADAVYVDSPDNIPKNFALRIEKYLKKKTKIISENKADDKYLIVSAASICAKVTRDAEIEKIKEEVGHDFNSGYTSDPITIRYLEKHVDDEKLKPYLREKWITLSNLRQRRLAEFE